MTRTIEAPLLDRVALVTGAGRASAAGSHWNWPGTAPIAAVADEIAEIGSKATTFVADVSYREAVFAPSIMRRPRSAAST